MSCWIFLVFLRMLADWVFRVIGQFVFRIGLGCFRLLIQRCKRCRGFGSFFVRGMDLPDEGENSATKGFGRTAKDCGRRAGVVGSKTKPPRRSAAANFLSGPSTIFFRLLKGIRITFFPGSTLAFFQVLFRIWILLSFSVWIQVWPFGFSDTRGSHRTWIVNGLSWINWTWFFPDFGSVGFVGSGRLVSQDLESWFRRIWKVGFVGSGKLVFRILIGVLLIGFGLFSLADTKM